LTFPDKVAQWTAGGEALRRLDRVIFARCAKIIREMNWLFNLFGIAPRGAPDAVDTRAAGS
jgi:hypothetical protein